MIQLTPFMVTINGTGPNPLSYPGFPSGSTQGVLITNQDPTQPMPAISCDILQAVAQPSDPNLQIVPSLYVVSGTTQDSNFVQGAAIFDPTSVVPFGQIPPPSSQSLDPSNYGWFFFGTYIQGHNTYAFPSSSEPAITYDTQGTNGKFYTIILVNDHTNPTIVFTIAGTSA